MRRIVLALGAMIVGCATDVTVPSPISVYGLLVVDGQRLPFGYDVAVRTLPPAADTGIVICHKQIVTGSLTLDGRSGTFTHQSRELDSCGAPTETASTTTGTFTQSGVDVVLTVADPLTPCVNLCTPYPQVFRGTITDNTISIHIGHDLILGKPL